DRSYAGGTLLTEGEVADEVGVSRTPVREAMLRLEVEGLLKLYPKKGVLVLPVSAQEIEDVVETRLLVEQHAARKAVPASPALLTR
ncbi:GntR family transcriptional regulator, partial [Streptomyces sp. SID11233]|nr:GntR family transcriptional regulator [Streptomyces sp. SID11233]